MKRTILTVLTILTLTLSACAGKSATTASQTSVPTATPVAQQATPGSSGPPVGSPPAAPPGGAGAPPASSAAVTTTSAAYMQSGGTETKANQTYTATETDQSGVWVANGGNLTLTNSTITTSGNTSSDDSSSFYGLNAAVLAASGSTIHLSDSTVTTSGTGANGVFATGSGSVATVSNVTIKATADGGHGVMATNGGSLTLTNVNMDTAGAHGAAIATDRGGGTISATGGTITTSGQDSPGLYSTGVIVVTGATIHAIGSEAAVIEGANSIDVTNTTLSGAKKWGVMIYQSMSGDAEGTRGVFTMTGGSLSAAVGPLFHVTNSTGVITLKGVQRTVTSGTLLDASAGTWGNSGSNGGTAILTADAQTLTGNLVADSLSSIAVTLQNGSLLQGAINSDNTAQGASLTLDASSTWNVTADSHLTCLDDAGGISGTAISNIIGNGHTVTYDKSACSTLGGKTYTLSGGGVLKPAD